VTQPTYTPVLRSGEVRPTRPTATPELGRAPKAGLLRHKASSALAGTPSPNEGYALTLAHQACHELVLPAGVDHHDIEIGIGLVAAKLASAAHRGPTIYDVRRAIAHFGLDQSPTAASLRGFGGLGHSYAAQRRFVDSVVMAELQ